MIKTIFEIGILIIFILFIFWGVKKMAYGWANSWNNFK
jgi:flagellar biogenesis protein FliO